MRARWSIVSLLVAAIAVAAPRADACGCFAAPTPADPVVQAGERLLFTRDGNDVVAYIQIQYQGSASDFGWLLPLPSVPALELATDELFDQLVDKTKPRYQLTTINHCNGSTSTGSGFTIGCGSSNNAAIGDSANDMTTSDRDMGEVVAQSSIGPYDYAVLKADDKTEMLDWLAANHYFIPAATGDAVTPYIHPGAFFLALKLKSGESTGSVQPVVVRYASDLPMIPIILTQVGAVPHMGIQVWELGAARAVPRNYYHAVLNDMEMWLDPSEKYETLVVNAVAEAPQKHAFITEYAGTSAPMRGVLAPPGRFGDAQALRNQATVRDYLHYLGDHGFLFDSNLLSILAAHITEPPSLVASGLSRESFFQNIDQSLAQLAQSDPMGEAALDAAFDPGATTDEIEMRVVTPTVDENALFDAHPYLTRLFTALSPEDMTADPVFSENPDLPDVDPVHRATLTQLCGGSGLLETADGIRSNFPRSTVGRMFPTALRIETLRDSGPPQLVTDNRAAIVSDIGPVDDSALKPQPSGGGSSSGASGCACSTQGRRADLGTLAMISLALIALQLNARRKRR